MRKFYIILALSLLAGRVCSKSPYCLENDIIYGYMHDFSYDTIADYTVSYVMEYFNKPADYRKDAPKPVTLSWTNDPAAEAQRIEVSENSDYSDAFVYTVGKDAGSYDVYNLIPGRKYYYRVVSVNSSAQESVVGSGDFETSGTLRMILAEGTWNVRDAGGWISSLTGKPIAYGKIYRGAQLKAANKDSIILSEEGIEAMRQIGIRAELDLRSSSQVPSNVSALAKKDAAGKYDVDFIDIPEAVNARMYNFAKNDATIRELQWVINRLKEKKPVYYHCQNGADRTGTLGFLIGALLGMSEGDLAKDYELTTFCEPIAAAYDPTEKGFARLRNYEGKKGSPIGGSEDPKEYMFAELATTMKSVAPVNGSYHDKIYNFFRTGVNGTKISAADLSWFIYEMTGYKILGDYTCNVDTIRLSKGTSKKINFTVTPEGAQYSKLSFKSTCSAVATVSTDGTVTAVGGGQATVIMSIDGIEKIIPVFVDMDDASVLSYSIENDAVSKYMTEANYSADDYTVSTVANYLDIPVISNRADWPAQVVLKWSVFKGAVNQHLSVCETPSFTGNIVDEEVLDTDSSYVFENLIPQKKYYYRVTAKVGDNTLVIVSSAFKVSGNAKMVQVRSIYNVRDLGGWIGKVGSTHHQVKCGVLFRGSRLKRNIGEGDGKAMISSEDNKILKALNIKAELDLRSDSETNASASTLNSRLFKFKRVANAGECLGANVLNGDAYVVALQQIITWLQSVDKNGDPAVPAIYMSGSLGAERTGTLAFLINGLLGVSEEDLSKDYELSSFSGDKLETVLCQRNTGDFPVMVASVKSLNGQDLQHKIYKYFNEGIGGTSITKTDLNWFISYMLDCPVSEVEGSYLTKVEIAPAVKVTGKIYNLLGQEVTNPGPGAYIMDGKKLIITE